MDINKIKLIVNKYNHIHKELNKIVEQYFKDNLEDWKHFAGWTFADTGDNIILYYSYENFCGNIETYSEFDYDVVSLETILNYDRTRNKK